MIFGITRFRCNECGTRFVSVAMEWRATVFLTPMPCPKCGGLHTYPAKLGGLFGPTAYREIWESMDENTNES